MNSRSWIPKTDTERRFVLTVLSLVVAVVFVAAGWIKANEFLYFFGGLVTAMLLANALDSGLTKAANRISASMRPPPMPDLRIEIPPLPDYSERRHTPYEMRAADPTEDTPTDSPASRSALDRRKR